MHHSPILADVLVLLVAAIVIVPLLKRLKSSPVIGYLAAGILIGPHGFGFISDAEGAQALAEFGVVFLLFTVGLELSFGRLKQLRTYVFGLGAAQVALTGAIIFGIALAFGISINAAIVIGAGLALSSTAFVLQLLTERGERATPYGTMSFAVLLFQDLIIVPLLILVPLLNEQGPSLLTAISQAGLKAVVALVVAVVVGRAVLRPVYRLIAASGSTELFVAATLLVVLSTGLVFSLAGLSMALGAFLAGLLLAETEYRHQVEADIRPFRGLFLGLFFMSVGMMVDIRVVIAEWLPVLGVVAGLLIGKSIVIGLLCRAFGLSAIVSGRVGLILGQGGEFGFVIFGVAMAAGILPPETGAVLFAAVTLTMALTPLMAYLGDRYAEWLTPGAVPPASDISKAGGELEDHIIIIGFGRVGQTVSMVLNATNTPHIALDRDYRLVAECRQQGTEVYYGAATEISVITAAGAARARAVVITINEPEDVSRAVRELRSAYPDLAIYVRARDLTHVRQLEDLGATAVVPETLEASLQLGGIIVRAIGISAEDSAATLDSFREDDYAMLHEIIASRGDTGQDG